MVALPTAVWPHLATGLGWAEAGIGIGVGTISFLVGCLICASDRGIGGLSAVGRIGEFVRFCTWNPRAVVFHLAVAGFEESVWRVVLQRQLGANAVAVALIALAFTLRHLGRMAGDAHKIAEFFIFSLIVGTTYMITNSFLAVVVIHEIRNLGVLYVRQDGGRRGHPYRMAPI